MLAYPIKFTKDDNGTILATSPDFPELTTFGDDDGEALLRATGALEEAIAARIAGRRPIPEPSRGKRKAFLPTQTAVKVLLYQTMQRKNIRKADLARMLAWHGPQVDRLLDIRHASRLDQIDDAMAVMDSRLNMEVEKRR
jgi:antitoxin HicB